MSSRQAAFLLQQQQHNRREHIPDKRKLFFQSVEEFNVEKFLRILSAADIENKGDEEKLSASLNLEHNLMDYLNTLFALVSREASNAFVVSRIINGVKTNGKDEIGYVTQTRRVFKETMASFNYKIWELNHAGDKYVLKKYNLGNLFCEHHGAVTFNYIVYNPFNHKVLPSEMNLFLWYLKEPEECALHADYSIYPWLQMIFHCVHGCVADFYLIINFLTWMMVCPGQKLGYMLCLIGPQGSGKSELIGLLKFLYGKNYYRVSAIKDLFEWNEWMKTALYIDLDDPFSSEGGGLKKHLTNLKPFISNIDSEMAVHQKFRDIKFMTNYSNISCTINRKGTGISCFPKQLDDRRFLSVFYNYAMPFESDTEKKKFDYNYKRWLNGPDDKMDGLFRIGHYLYKRADEMDEMGFKPFYTEQINSSINQEEKINNMDKAQRAVYDILNACENYVIDTNKPNYFDDYNEIASYGEHGENQVDSGINEYWDDEEILSPKCSGYFSDAGMWIRKPPADLPHSRGWFRCLNGDRIKEMIKRQHYVEGKNGAACGLSDFLKVATSMEILKPLGRKRCHNGRPNLYQFACLNTARKIFEKVTLISFEAKPLQGPDTFDNLPKKYQTAEIKKLIDNYDSPLIFCHGYTWDDNPPVIRTPPAIMRACSFCSNDIEPSNVIQVTGEMTGIVYYFCGQTCLDNQQLYCGL